MRTLVWFSCGAASAVAAKLAVERYGDGCEVVTCDTRSTEHPDNERFFRDVERWIGRSITEVRSSDYGSIDEVFERTRYMSGIYGARCTVEMKKAPRVEYQTPGDVHVFGYTADEYDRAQNFETNNPELHVEWILIEQFVTKSECLARIRRAGIAIPEMYRLGFEHNNCLACVKATSPDYWNLTRLHFPDAFARRAAQSRALGVKLVRVKGERVFLDVLAADEVGGGMEAIDCGPMCQGSFDFLRR